MADDPRRDEPPPRRALSLRGQRRHRRRARDAGTRRRARRRRVAVRPVARPGRDAAVLGGAVRRPLQRPGAEHAPPLRRRLPRRRVALARQGAGAAVRLRTAMAGPLEFRLLPIIEFGEGGMIKRENVSAPLPASSPRTDVAAIESAARSNQNGAPGKTCCRQRASTIRPCRHVATGACRGTAAGVAIRGAGRRDFAGAALSSPPWWHTAALPRCWARRRRDRRGPRCAR